jgi:hypothetical protein
MRKSLLVFFLLGVLLYFVPAPAAAQVSTTGPAGLARQMPRIYSPYMANRARIKYKQKHKQRRPKATHRARRSHR